MDRKTERMMRTVGDGDTMDTHEFLIENGNRAYPAPEMVMDLRDYLDEMPETKTVFKLKDAIELAGYGGTDLLDNTLKLCGVWRVPNIYPRGDNATIATVNPERGDAGRYADTYEKCECGAIFTHPQTKDSDVDPAIRGANRHNEGCKPYHRHEMKASLLRQREAVIKEAMYYGIKGMRLARRLQLKHGSTTSVVRRLGIDGDRLRKEHRQRRANTMAELSRLGYKRAEIAKVYGVAKSHVSREVKRFTDTMLSEIKEERA